MSSDKDQSSPWKDYIKSLGLTSMSSILSYILFAVVAYLIVTGNISTVTNLAFKLVSGIMNVLTGLS